MKKYSLLVLSLVLTACFLVRNPALPPLPLRVTIEALDSTGNACRICSDGVGHNVDGVDGVSAAFTKYGWLTVSLPHTATFLPIAINESKALLNASRTNGKAVARNIPALVSKLFLTIIFLS